MIVKMAIPDESGSIPATPSIFIDVLFGISGNSVSIKQMFLQFLSDHHMYTSV